MSGHVPAPVQFVNNVPYTCLSNVSGCGSRTVGAAAQCSTVRQATGTMQCADDMSEPLRRGGGVRRAEELIGKGRSNIRGVTVRLWR